MNDGRESRSGLTNMIAIDELRRLFFEALDIFAIEESKNILSGTSERNLCGRLAPILERQCRNAGLHGYKADPEYNRNDGKVKTIIDSDLQIVPITCDIILHSRGTIIEKDNLIAIEMKRLKHPEPEKQKDRMRLRAPTKASYDDIWSVDGKTLPAHVCGYELGYLVIMDVRKKLFHLEEYVRGALFKKDSRPF